MIVADNDLRRCFTFIRFIELIPILIGHTHPQSPPAS